MIYKHGITFEWAESLKTQDLRLQEKSLDWLLHNKDMALPRPLDLRAIEPRIRI
jgi:hypothetical protein